LSALIVDASVMVAALVQNDGDGPWAEQVIERGRLAAPHLLQVEVANILRRLANGGAISEDVASLAYDELLKMRIELFAYGPFAVRIWSLRANVRPYAAWYVALAEALDAPLATLDLRLSRASGPACRFLVPGAGIGQREA
jgi:predicted nucleic acid-binding protein